MTWDMATGGCGDIEEIAYRSNHSQHQLIHLPVLVRSTGIRRRLEISQNGRDGLPHLSGELHGGFGRRGS